MDRELVYVITDREAGMKIEEFLRTIGCSHHVLTHLKRTEGGILRNGEWTYSSTRLERGDQLLLHITEDAPSEQILPADLPIDIVYEDEDLLIVNKAAGMAIHPSAGHHSDTLANAVVQYYASRGLTFVYRCINRLDRDTSGLLILAKNRMSAAILGQLSADRKIRRQYLAVAEGIVPPTGTIDAPIARKPGSAIMRCVDEEQGERAVTHFCRLAVLPSDAPDKADAAPLSVLKLRLETGRTHQIRVHMAHIGHPLCGDFLYNPDSDSRIARQALHAWKLDFPHPITKKELHFTAALPDDLKSYCDFL